MSYIFLLFCLFVVWKYVFRDPGQFPHATVVQKIIHSVVLLMLFWGCWGWVFTLKWILMYPHRWVEYLTQTPRAYPAAFDALFQVVGSIVGPTGALCCYFTLRGYDKARRLLLALLPAIFLADLYAEVATFTRVHGLPSFPVFAIGTLLLSIPFWFILGFYRHPRVVESLFTGGGSREHVIEHA